MTKFRQKAMQALEKPEVLDNALTVVTPTGWLIFLSIAALFFTLTIWAVFGDISSSVSGNGILISSGQLTIVASKADGVINSLETYDGQKVSKGDVLGRIWQTQLEDKYVNLQNELQFVMEEREYREKNNQIANVAQELKSTSLLLSPIDGTVMDVNKALGESIKKGETFAVVQMGGMSSQLMALAFFSGGDGKKIEEGAQVRIALDNVRSDEFGFLVGKIKNISLYPTNSNLLAGWLGNADYAKKVLEEGKGLVYLAQVQIIPDENTKSGYLWTSKAGPPKEIEQGTTFTAHCIIKKERPIIFAFNWLKTLLEGN